MLITRLPIAHNDETLYSFAARIRVSNAARDDRSACRGMFGSAAHMRVAEFPVNLVHFCRVTQGVMGTPETVLAEMTLANFFGRIGGHPWHAGSSAQPVATAGYGLSSLSNGSVSTWRACRQCLRSDLSAFATGHWRRSHQLPTAFFCLQHGTPLSQSLAPAHAWHNRFMLPQDTALRETAHGFDGAANDEALLRLTQLAVDALCDVGPSVVGDVTYATMCRALGDRGMLTHSGAIRRDAFCSELLRHYGFLREYPDFAAAVSAKGLDILYRSVRCVGQWRRPLHNLLLLDWLFGSWKSFCEQSAWQSVMGCPNLLAEAAPSRSDVPPAVDHAIVNDTGDRVREIHRRKCVDFLERNTHAVRSRFARAEPKSCRWLLANDIAWFDQYCPIDQRDRPQANLF
ncbi:hypothetical protein F2P44_23760 [Massilia sp. CCM 8695]|uniref:TniQ domain-containing protein n=1 Tax=Massilia frigida TaxID=2609281 RepID=A0ABX0NFW9_9BURK|nr:TniQ family protein [Massilia frigida]NHZ82271.1 hypothetical protein [Massilia frigida]